MPLKVKITDEMVEAGAAAVVRYSHEKDPVANPYASVEELPTEWRVHLKTSVELCLRAAADTMTPTT